MLEEMFKLFRLMNTVTKYYFNKLYFIIHLFKIIYKLLTNAIETKQAWKFFQIH